MSVRIIPIHQVRVECAVQTGPEYKLLRDSIAQKGVLNPIAVVQEKNHQNREVFIVIDGAQRFLAAMELGHNTIPVNVMECNNVPMTRKEAIAEGVHVLYVPGKRPGHKKDQEVRESIAAETIEHWKKCYSDPKAMPVFPSDHPIVADVMKSANENSVLKGIFPKQEKLVASIKYQPTKPEDLAKLIRNFKWQTKDGKELRLNQITDKHLGNILRMLAAKTNREFAFTVLCFEAESRGLKWEVQKGVPCTFPMDDDKRCDQQAVMWTAGDSVRDKGHQQVSRCEHHRPDRIAYNNIACSGCLMAGKPMVRGSKELLFCEDCCTPVGPFQAFLSLLMVILTLGGKSR
jgi:hypothetical protein